MEKLAEDLLQEVAIFGGIKMEIIRHLLENASNKALEEGDVLFQEGDDSQCMYLIEQGRIAVTKAWQSQDYLLKELSVGECIGEMALFDFSPRSATATALQPTRVIEITSQRLLEVYDRDLEQFTLIQMNLGREVTRRLRETDRCLFKQRIKAQVIDGVVIMQD